MSEDAVPTMNPAVSCRIEQNFRTWIDRLQDGSASDCPHNRPSLEPGSASDGKAAATGIDLYSFYSELCALRFEFRKNFQRSHESTSRFSEVLDQFAQRLQQLDGNQRQPSATAEQELTAQIKSKLFLALIDIHDRFVRLKENLEKPLPPGSFWRRRRRVDELEKRVRQLAEGCSILERHFTLLLAGEGVKRQSSTGRKFDPTSMTVIEVADRAEAAADQVVAEIAAGYSFDNTPLRLAKVVVNRGKP